MMIITIATTTTTTMTTMMMTIMFAQLRISIYTLQSENNMDVKIVSPAGRNWAVRDTLPAADYTSIQYLSPYIWWLLLPPRRLCNARRLFVCFLSVCLLATLRKNYWTDLRENFTTDVYLFTRKNWLNFGSNRLPDPNPGIWKDSSTLRDRTFSHSLLFISAENVIGSSWKFFDKCNLGQGRLLNFGSYPD